MKKEARIKNTREFKAIYSGGKSLASREIVLYSKQGRSDATRIGISVSKRLGNAVERNKTKRLLREAFKNNADRIRSGYDIVVIARQPIKGKSFQHVEKAFIDILQRAGLVKHEEHNSGLD